jgi:hypothetical protein
MAASLSITVNIPTSETRAIEVMWASRGAELASHAVRRAGGTVTTANITADGGQVIGTWTYTPQAAS